MIMTNSVVQERKVQCTENTAKNVKVRIRSDFIYPFRNFS